MDRPIAVVGAPSSIGIRPYDDGQARQLDRAPSVLRERGLVAAARRDRYRETSVRRRTATTCGRRIGRGTRKRSWCIPDRSANASPRRTRHGRFAVVLGGDCSIVLGCLLGARRTAGGRVGLAYVDAHADFATPEESRTGSVSSMCLALAVGRGKTPLARLAGRSPLVDACDVALVGRRDTGMGWHGHGALSAFDVLDMPDSQLFTNDLDELTAVALARVAAPGVNGFWIQIDADVLNPAVMSAVDSPEPGGPMPGELVSLLRPLVEHPLALGLSLTIYDPALDADRSCARRLVSLLEGLLAPVKPERDCAARN